MKRFKNGDKVVFLGDSLIAQNYYTQLIIDAYKKNFADEEIRFYNCGTAGGTAEFALQTLDEDTLSYSPTHVIIAFGVNDSHRWVLEGPRSPERYNELYRSYQNFTNNISSLCNRIREKGITPILCTPAPYDEYAEEGETPLRGAHALVCGFASFVRSYAEREGIELIDYHEYLTKRIQTEKVIGDDHIHPIEHGYYLMARYFLSRQGIDLKEEAESLPPYFTNWHEKLTMLRRIYAAECMIICHPELNEEQRLVLMRNYVEKGARNQYFENMANEYLRYKSDQDKIKKEMLELYEREVL